jgi:very-short-patch-repair endonuclease
LKSTLKPFAKHLRKKSTDTESVLWKQLRAKRFEGLKWRRQEPIGKYIVDFVCYEKRIIVECDGSQHLVQKDKDSIRDEWLRDRGYKILRFWDNEVLQNLDIVLETIWKVSSDHPPPHPLPSNGGGKENQKQNKVHF